MPIGLLIVEDDPTTLEMLTKVTKATFPDLFVQSAHNPDTALSLFRKHHHHIIVSDMRVPRQDDGLRIAQSICAEKPDAIIFFVTGELNVSMASLSKNVRNLCLHEVFKKPLDIKLFTEKIREAVGCVISGQAPCTA